MKTCPHLFFGYPAAPSRFTLQGARPDLPPPGLVVWGAGRRFSIISTGSGERCGRVILDYECS